ncbi:MAG: hypothetical protein JOZ73_02770 [Solirubrobacterales bacterium]|nr:hypothetical protein [Solirubrobacterales bacterium]
MIEDRTTQLAGSSARSLPIPALLDLCDRLLHEVGRRRHLFAWLRAAGAGPEEWLAIDCYYPGNRLVVICREEPAEHDHLYRELVPAHGMRLLELVPAELGGDEHAAARAISERIASLGPAPERPREVLAPVPQPKARRREGPSEASRRAAAIEAAVMRAASSLAPPAPPPSEPRRVTAAQLAAMQRASRLAEQHKRTPVAISQRPAPAVRRKPPVQPRTSVRRVKRAAALEPASLLAGLALVALLLIEMYLDVDRIALAHGWVLLAFGIALEAVARALGTIAAVRAGRPAWAWACAVLGSPAVAVFALFRTEGPVASDPAPLAGLMSLVAIGVMAFGALLAVLNI